jgi:ABC-type transport system involved in multi-copper enzyme maturation permease subunit
LSRLWSKARDNPILQLEVRRIRRRRWWPGRRFFLFYPVLLGIALGFGVMLVPTNWVGVQVAAVATGVSLGAVLGTVVWLLGMALPWIAPALAAATIAREREMGTFDMLRTTLLSERGIVLGKLGACLAQLWPGVLLLVLLAPFQVIGTLGGGALCLCPSYTDLSALAFASELGVEYVIVSFVLSAFVGTLRPLADVAFNIGLGMFVSTLLRSSGAAVAASYGVVLVFRVAAWLATTVMSAVLVYGSMGPAVLDAPLANPGAGLPVLSWLVPSLAPLMLVVGETLAALLLIWGAIWRLERE